MIQVALCEQALSLYDMGGMGHDGPQNVFDHCAQMLKKRKLKLCELLILIYGASRKVIFGSLGNPVLP